MIKTIIIEDEKLARDLVKNFVSDFGEIEITGEFEDGFTGLKGINELKPDLIFLDIRMPKLSGFELLELLDYTPNIIFTTAYDEFAIKAFELNAVDYLLKPISRERFAKALEKLSNLLSIDEAPVEMISVKIGASITPVKVDSIERISFDDGLCFIHRLKEKLYTDKSLNNFEATLIGSSFYRISRTDIINLNYIKKLHQMFKGQYIVEMKNGDKIDISRRRLQGLKELLN